MREAKSVLRTLSVSIGAGLLGVALPATAQPPSNHSGCSLHVHVTDEDGADLPKAFVFVHSEHGGNQQLTPDRTGQVRINLHSGMYDLFVSASGFVPQAQIVDLRSCKPANVNLMLTIDSEHSENDGSKR